MYSEFLFLKFSVRESNFQLPRILPNHLRYIGVLRHQLLPNSSHVVGIVEPRRHGRPQQRPLAARRKPATLPTLPRTTTCGSCPLARSVPSVTLRDVPSGCNCSMNTGSPM